MDVREVWDIKFIGDGGGRKLVRVIRNLNLPKDQSPTTEAVIAQLKEKYGSTVVDCEGTRYKPALVAQQNGVSPGCWAFDAKGALWQIQPKTVGRDYDAYPDFKTFNALTREECSYEVDRRLNWDEQAGRCNVSLETTRVCWPNQYDRPYYGAPTPDPAPFCNVTVRALVATANGNPAIAQGIGVEMFDATSDWRMKRSNAAAAARAAEEAKQKQIEDAKKVASPKL